jgi:hypothetical protein
MGLRFFLVLVFLVLAAAAVFFWTDALLAGVPFAGALFAGVFSGVEDWDWATAGGQKPSQRRKKVPAKTTTAKRRTQTLPTAESWHP